MQLQITGRVIILTNIVFWKGQNGHNVVEGIFSFQLVLEELEKGIILTFWNMIDFLLKYEWDSKKEIIFFPKI